MRVVAPTLVIQNDQIAGWYYGGMPQVPILGELMYEVDSLYVSTEMILSKQFRKTPLDGFLLEACLLHFRVVWDFFYRGKKWDTDVVVTDFLPTWSPPDAPPRLREIREWLNVMLAHLTSHRVDSDYKALQITMDDVRLIRSHTEALFGAFHGASLTQDQRSSLVNPLADKFRQYRLLSDFARS